MRSRRARASSNSEAASQRRREQADFDPRRCASFVAEDQRKTLHAAVARNEEGCKAADQTLQRKCERAVRFDAERKLQAMLEKIRRPVPQQGFRGNAARAIDPADRILADSSRELGARQAEQIAQQTKTHAVQRCCDFLVEIAQGNRHEPECMPE